MTDLTEQLLTWLAGHRDLAVYLVPAIAFAEACPGIGLVVSGVILVAVCSFIHGEQILPLSQIVQLAFLGALASDHLGYYLGRWLGPAFHQTRFARNQAPRIARAEALVRKYGWGAILIGRFIPAIRSLVPGVTGLGGFHALHYSIADIIACALWASGLALILEGIAHLLASA